MVTIKAFNCAANVVQVNVIKRFNPNYKTWVETAKEKDEEKQRITEEETKRIADEIAEESKEDLKEREMSALVDTKKIEDRLKEKGHIFIVRSFYILDNYIWACGDFLYETSAERNHYCPAIVISENGGIDYAPLKVFKELGRVCSSNLLFLEKNTGYLSLYTLDGSSAAYKTNDGGRTWDIILNTIDQSGGNYIRRIRVKNKNVYLIVSFQGSGYPALMESNDSGGSWIYKRNNKEMVETFDKGITWEVVKKGE